MPNDVSDLLFDLEVQHVRGVVYDWKRLIDAVVGSVAVIDNAGNPIVDFGSYGNFDSPSRNEG